MKIRVSKTQLGGLAPAQWLRRAGYGYIVDHRSGQDSFVRRLYGGHYPRFHLYIQDDGGDEIFFNLHLDQKQASYAGQARHSGEYEGDLVEQEAARLQALLRPAAASGGADTAPERDVLASLQPKKLVEKEPEPKKPWWRRLFT